MSDDIIRILLVDDHAIVRAGFHHMLLKESDMKVVAEAETGDRAVELYQTLAPDVVVMDLSMPADDTTVGATSTASGLDAIKRMLSLDPQARILVMTVWESCPYLTCAAKAGARGYVSKRCAERELVHAIREIHTGRCYFSDSVDHHSGQPPQTTPPQAPIALLTRRELEVFTLLAEGNSVNAVAEAMCLSPKTVHTHRANILRKLGLSSGSELIYLALHSGIIHS
jgi:two-component system invasion response regulator UvrY